MAPAFMEANHLGWSRSMAPVIMANPDRPELAAELGDSLCRTDPDIARHFARTTFTWDNRADLERVHTPALIMRSARDVIAPIASWLGLARGSLVGEAGSALPRLGALAVSASGCRG